MASALPKIIRNIKLLTHTQCGRLPIHRTIPALQLQQIRDSSYRSSQPVQSLDQYPEVEVVENPPEWKYVERLLPAPIVPKPTAKAPCPSGWQPQLLKGEHKHGYHVARTKNYMVPVYLQTRFRGLRRITLVRRIQGDIWALERDLRKVVEAARNGKVCASRVNELSGQIQFHGDYVDVVREHLKAEGF